MAYSIARPRKEELSGLYICEAQGSPNWHNPDDHVASGQCSLLSEVVVGLLSFWQEMAIDYPLWLISGVD